MDWVTVVQHVIVSYVGFGAYCGYRWTRSEGDSILFAASAGAFMGVLLWPFVMTSGNPNDFYVPVPAKRTAHTKAARAELKRMRNEREIEQAQVELLEASGEHRKIMAEYAERRRRVEEIA